MSDEKNEFTGPTIWLGYRQIVGEAVGRFGLAETKWGAGTPDWDDLRGRAPEITGDLSSEVFVRKHRSDWR